MQVEFFEDKLVIGKYHLHLSAESFFSSFITAEYSRVGHCEYIMCKTEQRSTLGGFAWGKIGPGSRMAILTPHKKDGQSKFPYPWNIEIEEFSSDDIPETDENEFRTIYNWLRK